MMRLGLSVALALSIGVLSITLSAGKASAAGSYDFAVGGGQSALGGFAFSVHCQVSGLADCTQTSSTPPSGHVVKKYTDPSTGKQDTIQGDATCLAVVGNTAWITWLVTSSKDSLYPEGSYFTFSAQDNGPPVNGNSPDLIGIDEPSPGIGLPPGGPNDCLVQGAPGTFTQGGVLSGNIVVNGGVSVPGTALSGDWWYTDAAGNLYILDDSGKWVLVQ